MKVMITRRTACSLAIGSAVALLGEAPACAAQTARRGIDYVLTDRRHPESLAFAQMLARSGISRLEVTAGLTRLWSDVLLPLWRNRGGMVAGLTLPGTWSCIQEQARSWGLRSILVGHHGLGQDGDEVVHRVEAPGGLRPRVEALARCGGDWPQVMAGLVSQCPTAPSRRKVAAYHGAYRGALSSTALVSWVIG